MLFRSFKQYQHFTTMVFIFGAFRHCFDIVSTMKEAMGRYNGRSADIISVRLALLSLAES